MIVAHGADSKCLDSDAAEWHGSDSENDDDSDSDEDEGGSESSQSDQDMLEEGDGQAPVEVEPMQIEIDELALTEAEVAAKKAEKARLEVWTHCYFAISDQDAHVRVC